jgi:hypothetical protein
MTEQAAILFLNEDEGVWELVSTDGDDSSRSGRKKPTRSGTWHGTAGVSKVRSGCVQSSSVSRGCGSSATG